MSRSARMWSLIALELPERDARVRGVLAVDGEQPRVVREARTDPADARHACPRTSTPCPGWSSGSRGRSAACVRSARFCLPQSIDSCSSRSPGRSSCDQRASASRAARLAGEQAARVGGQRGELAARLGDRVVRAGHGDPHVVEPLAGTRRGSAAARRCRGRTGRRRTRSASAQASGRRRSARPAAERPVVARPDLAAARRAVRADDRRVGVVARLARQPARCRGTRAVPRRSAPCRARCRSRSATVPAKPHGYWVISSECASTITVDGRASRSSGWSA